MPSHSPSTPLMNHTPHERRDVQPPLVGLRHSGETFRGVWRNALPPLVGLVEVTSIACVARPHRWPCGPGGRARVHLGAVKAGGNHGDAQLVLELLIDDCSKNDMGLFVGT